MPNKPTSFIRIAALTALIGGVALIGPLHAAANASDPQQNAMGQTPPGSAKTDQSPEAAAQRIEDRIKTLHDKLGVTPDQESKWGDVAKAMRDNETATDQLIRARHQNPTSMTAVDDLQSYENITQAHADGLKDLIVAFQALYDAMPDDQKKNADMTFSRFEGHDAGTTSRKHS